jgi:thiol:disulfide interchange protein DsbD
MRLNVRPTIHAWGSGLLIVAMATFANSGRAASTGGSKNTTVALLSEHSTVQAGKTFYVGLEMKVREGWHTYWKNPGDAGMSLRVKWILPPGFSAGSIEWPTPERIPTRPEMSYGYHGRVLLLVPITPPQKIADHSITIAGTFDWLECKEVCLAGSARLDLTLPVKSGTPAPSGTAGLFAEARSRVPRAPTGWKFSAAAGPRAISLAIRTPAGTTPRGAYFFVEQPLVVEYAARQGFERDGNGYRLTLTSASNARGLPKRLTGVLVLTEGDGRLAPIAVHVDVPVIPRAPAAAAPQSTTDRNQTP